MNQTRQGMGMKMENPGSNPGMRPGMQPGMGGQVDDKKSLVIFYRRILIL